MGEGVAMRHTCNRRVKDAEEVGPPRGGGGGSRGVGPLSPSNALRLQTARGNGKAHAFGWSKGRHSCGLHRQTADH